MALQRKTIQVQGADRTYWLAPAVDPDSPLLIVLHGSGMSGPLMAEWTGLATRGPAAGFTTVFPDAHQERWDDTGLGRADGLDDAAFVAALVDLLQKDHLPRRRVVLVGLSNGASFAELLARRAVVAVDGFVLVAGTARVVSRRTVPVPCQPASVLIVLGTADPQLPYIDAGHGWPGSRQYAPAWLVGRIPQGFDATAAVLDFAAQSTGGRLVE